jgi:hypothetical protein
MLEIYERAKTECKYNAARFLQMVAERGGLQAARQLLRTPGVSEGFTALCLCKRLDLTVEAHVLNPQWRGLFTEEEIKIAEKRLSDVGYNHRAWWTKGVIPVVRSEPRLDFEFEMN